MPGFWMCIVGTFWVTLGVCREYSPSEIRLVVGQKKSINIMPAFWISIVGGFWVTLGVYREYSLLEIQEVVVQKRHPHHAHVLDLHCGSILGHIRCVS